MAQTVTVAAEPTLDTLLVFLATSCGECAGHWAALELLPQDLPPGTRIAVVTPSPALEDRSRARQLTPANVRLHMGSETWFMYGVGRAGTFALVRSPRGGPEPWDAPGEVLGLAYLADPDAAPATLRRWQQPRSLDAGPI